MTLNEWADQHDALFIKSAGNEGWNGIGSPGTARNVVTVGAVHYITEASDTLGKLTAYSSQGPTRNDILKPEIVAPGGSGGSCAERGVVSCGLDSVFCKQWDAQYSYSAAKGTSFAAPHVSGAAAVMAEAYDEWYRFNHYQDPDYAPSALLMRALLVNTAIPVRWNGSWPHRHIGSPADTLATGEFLSGLANTEYGYGLVNCYSGVHSPDSEYRRVVVWQGAVQGVGDFKEKDFNLKLRDDYGNVVRPRYLVVTMAYNDLPGANVVDRLKLSLIDPQLQTFEYRVPPQTSLVAGTVQKIIIPWPNVSLGGNWKVKVGIRA